MAAYREFAMYLKMKNIKKFEDKSYPKCYISNCRETKTQMNGTHVKRASCTTMTD